MPKTDLKVNLDAPVEQVYEIMNDFMILPRWNITVNGITELEPDKYSINSTVGDVINIAVENIPNERMTSIQENSPMQKIGYIFESKGNTTEVTLWTEFELEDQRSVLDIAADLFLKSLKAYVDYIVEGGNPEDYKKKFSVIKKVKLT
ncbi:MAG: SRPBCC family protein [Candidatus Lokiarchaeota archaeon]